MPQVLPYFRSAVSAALGLCWKAGTAAEVIGLSGGTIGERLYTAKVYFQTPDLFEQHRMEMATREWARMKASGSATCKSCHSFDGMQADLQKQRARKQHEMAREDNETCIDCHKGIAHKLPEGMTEEEM